MNLAEVQATYIPWVEEEMRSLLETSRPAVDRHYAIMQYHMGWRDAELKPATAASGKRIRPLLCLLACAAAGGDPRQAVPAAAGLELLHNFSLIHDDIEDGSETRRHRPTAWVEFGLAVACNAGDAMFSLARAAYHRLPGLGVPIEATLQAMRIFDETSVALTEGQYLDISYETRLDVTISGYFEMIDGKTAALLAAAPQMGAAIALAEPEVIAAYRRFGRALGLGFQLQDDVLGIWGEEALTGKSAAADILSKKKTLPVIYALEHEATGPELRARYAGPAFTAEDLPAILALLEAAGARAYVEARVQDALGEARNALQAAQRGAGSQEPLYELLEVLSGREA